MSDEPWVEIRCRCCNKLLGEMRWGVVRKVCPRCGAIVVVIRDRGSGAEQQTIVTRKIVSG